MKRNIFKLFYRTDRKSLTKTQTYRYKRKIDRSSPSDTLGQLVERGASNDKVPGSNLGWSVIFSLTVMYVVWSYIIFSLLYFYFTLH